MTAATQTSAAAAGSAPPGLDDVSLRAAYGRFATGVAFVTAEVDGSPLGLIVSSFATVSLVPPLVSFCPAHSSLTWRRMRTTGRFAINVLGSRHGGFARRAAHPGTDRFAEAGAALRDAVAAIDCDIEAEHVAGDHWIVVGRVTRLHVSAARDPLVYFAGCFGAFDPIEQETPRPRPRQTPPGGHRAGRDGGRLALADIVSTGTEWRA